MYNEKRKGDSLYSALRRTSVGEHTVAKCKDRFNKLRSVSQVSEYPEYNLDDDLHLGEFFCL